MLLAITADHVGRAAASLTAHPLALALADAYPDNPVIVGTHYAFLFDDGQMSGYHWAMLSAEAQEKLTRWYVDGTMAPGVVELGDWEAGPRRSRVAAA